MSGKSASQQFSKDIVHEDFYVLNEEGEENIEFETTTTTTKVQIVEPEKFRKEKPPDEEAFDLTEDISPEEQEDEAPIQKKTDADAEELGTDFFEKGEDEDAEKKQVVEEIAGMSETTETEAEIVTKKDEVTISETAITKSVTAISPSKEIIRRQSRTIKPGSIQFKHGKRGLEKEDGGSDKSIEDDKIEKVSSRKSIDHEKSFRRTSGIPELMKMSKKSLLALSTSADGSTRKSLGPSGVVPGDSRFSFSRKEGDQLLTVPDYFGKQPMKVFEGGRRSTFYAELGPRYRQVEDEEWDFDIGGDAPIFFDVVAEEEEEIIIQEEEAPVKLERGPFYDRHDKAAQEIITRKTRNCILHKKLSMYFKRKKMDYVTKETDWSFDIQHKYSKKLESYGELMDFISYEKVRVTQELDETRETRSEKFKKLTSMFKKMQDREGEIGYGLINTKTGNPLPDKFVERLIRRQNTQLNQVSSMRLTYIRLKGMVQEKLDGIANLNEIAPGFLLVDYEQLKSDNRAYADKIEEKDEELTRLRIKCSSTIQVLAHLREKTSALENDLEDLLMDRKNLECFSFGVRSRLNEQKQARDNIRHALNKLRDESGLLTQPTLLKDMEQGLTEIKHLTNQLKQITKEHKKKAKQIKIIRKRIEQTVDLRRGISRRDLTQIHSTVRGFGRKNKSTQVYKGRPSLLMPIVEDSAFYSLTAIRPKLTYDRSQRNRNNMKQSKRAGG